MENNNNNNSVNKSEEEKRRELQERFDRNYYEFKNKSIKDMPCLRSTLLTSIPASLVAGLLSYLVTSKYKVSSHVVAGTFLTVTGGFFVNCRMEFEKKVKQNKELGEIMNLIIKYRGTDLEQQLQQTYKEKLQEIDSKSKYV